MTYPFEEGKEASVVGGKWTRQENNGRRSHSGSQSPDHAGHIDKFRISMNVMESHWRILSIGVTLNQLHNFNPQNYTLKYSLYICCDFLTHAN